MNNDVFSGVWIWENEQNRNDEYVEFFSTFTAKKGETCSVKISADTDYELFINGEKVGFGQYPDYPSFKIYDRYDVSQFAKDGENSFAVRAYHSGANVFTHYPYKSGVIFEVTRGDTVLLKSGEAIRSRVSREFVSYRERLVTSQLGYSYAADLTKRDLWTIGEGEGFHDSVQITGYPTELIPRPVKKLEVGELVNGALVKRDKGYFLYDLGREEVVYPFVKIFAKEKCDARLSWGEHILDGSVRRDVGGREFSIKLTLSKGENAFSSSFLRLGARYLQLESDGEIEVAEAGGYPVYYPVTVLQKKASTPLRQAIYDTSVRTLRLCMHDHYEDCPWREQSMYAMDSRNQMLCGYYAFKEYDFAKACLNLMCNDPVGDGLTSICFPCNHSLKIPSFTLHWFIAMCEYAENSNDYELLEKYWDSLIKRIEFFLARSENGILSNFDGDENLWNFYEWSDGLSGTLLEPQEKRFELVLNCLVSIVLQKLSETAQKMGKSVDYLEQAKLINKRIYEAFYDEARGIFCDYIGEKHYSELGNALAVLCGAAGDKSKDICAVLTKKDNGLVEASLSMSAFLYDALLKTDEAGYSQYVIKDIDEKYGGMLASGATSFWETLLGADDFDGAGSLCHGWAALPVYYYHLLGEVK